MGNALPVILIGEIKEFVSLSAGFTEANAASRLTLMLALALNDYRLFLNVCQIKTSEEKWRLLAENSPSFNRMSVSP